MKTAPNDFLYCQDWSEAARPRGAAASLVAAMPFRISVEVERPGPITAR
jgi:hypothetical protein